MARHVVLLEAGDGPMVRDVAARCAEADAPLHLVTPAAAAEAAGRAAGPDVWVHPTWFDFRDAIARGRCLYFDAEGPRDAREAVFPPNAALVIGRPEGGLPARVREKHPEHYFRLPPAATLADAVGALLALTGSGVAPRRRRR